MGFKESTIENIPRIIRIYNTLPTLHGSIEHDVAHQSTRLTFTIVFADYTDYIATKPFNVSKWSADIWCRTCVLPIISWYMGAYCYPADTRRNNNVIMSSKRRRDVILTSYWRYYCVMYPMGSRHIVHFGKAYNWNNSKWAGFCVKHDNKYLFATMCFCYISAWLP